MMPSKYKNIGEELAYKQAQLCWDAMQCQIHILREGSFENKAEQLRFQLKLNELIGEFLDLPGFEMDEYGRVSINRKQMNKYIKSKSDQGT